MKYLLREEIIFIHRTQLSLGGFDSGLPENLENPNSFEYLLNIVDAEIYGEKLYKDIYQVAAAYIFHIIKDHIFFDACKRTGVQSALLFLNKNGYQIKQESISSLTLFTITIEKKEIDFEGIVNWFKNNIVKL